MACLIGYKNGMSMSLVALGSPQNTLVVLRLDELLLNGS